MRSLTLPVLVVSFVPALALADYPDFHAAITKQINPINPADNSIVELVTVVPAKYELRFKSLKTPQGVAFKSETSPNKGCATQGGRCRQAFTMAIDASSSGKCKLDGNYVASFDVACTNTKDASCKPGTHDVAFSLQSENFCSATNVSTAGLWQQVPGTFAADVGAGGSEVMWLLDAKESGPGGYQVVTLGLNSKAGMRRGADGVRIDADGNGNGFLVNQKDEMYRYNGTGWTRVPGAARDVGIGADGTAWHIGKTAVAGGYTIHRWNKGSNRWEDVKGGAVRIDVDPHGNAWVVNDQGTVYRWDGGRWVDVGGVLANDVGIGANGAVFVAGRDGIVYKREGDKWVNHGGRQVTDITVTASGVPIAIDSSHQLWIGQP